MCLVAIDIAGVGRIRSVLIRLLLGLLIQLLLWLMIQLLLCWMIRLLLQLGRLGRRGPT